MRIKEDTRVRITNVVFVIRKKSKTLIQESINTTSDQALILPSQGDTVFFAREGQPSVTGTVKSVQFGYWYNGKQTMNEAVEIELE
jgi:hypothetical protein